MSAPLARLEKTRADLDAFFREHPELVLQREERLRRRTEKAERTREQLAALLLSCSQSTVRF